MKKLIIGLLIATIMFMQIPCNVFASNNDLKSSIQSLDKLSGSDKSALLSALYDCTVTEVKKSSSVTSDTIVEAIKVSLGNTKWNAMIDEGQSPAANKLSKAALNDVVKEILKYGDILVGVYDSFSLFFENRAKVKAKLSLPADATDYQVFSKIIEKTGAVITLVDCKFAPVNNIGTVVVDSFGLNNSISSDDLGSVKELLSAFINRKLGEVAGKLNAYVAQHSENTESLTNVLRLFGIFKDPTQPPPQPPSEPSTEPSDGNKVDGDTITGTPKQDDNGNTTLTVSADSLKKAEKEADKGDTGVKTVVIDVKEVKGTKDYIVQLPVAYLASDRMDRVVEIKTPIGTIEAPNNMLNTGNVTGTADVSLSMGMADPKDLPEELKDRPVLEISVIRNGSAMEWSNADAPVTISYKYANPTAEELKDPEHIVVWYVDGKGNIQSVPNGKYDPETGMVTFITTHLSNYAIAFVHKTFSDAGKYAWAKTAIEVLASRGAIDGITKDTFEPDTNITRADYLAALVRVLGLTAKAESNFNDIKPTDSYYTEIGIAKALGITGGTGRNRFSPNAAITRQEMMTFTMRAMKCAGLLKEIGTDSDLKKFTDISKLAAYAKESAATMVKLGIIEGTGNKLNPTINVTRAQAAVVLYRLAKL